MKYWYLKSMINDDKCKLTLCSEDKAIFSSPIKASSCLV